MCSTAAGSGRGEKCVTSVGSAVEFAKVNNLLGLLVDSDLLVWLFFISDCIYGITFGDRSKYHH